MIVILGLHAAVACADGGSGLVLPLTVALAVVSSAHQASEALTAAPTRAPGLEARLLPARLHIPDGYALDVTRDPPRFARPLHHDRLMSVDLLSRPRWTASLAYDEDSLGPLARTGEVVRLFVEYPF
ncbi:MAG TPA: hypothetical protein VKW76_00965 [Candidatus Binatia bacterium]|nr:hypothetical protein [Candidatus Binatia bacterium]